MFYDFGGYALKTEKNAEGSASPASAKPQGQKNRKNSDVLPKKLEH